MFMAFMRWASVAPESGAAKLWHLNLVRPNVWLVVHIRKSTFPHRTPFLLTFFLLLAGNL
jgi:hypothetical protein